MLYNASTYLYLFILGYRNNIFIYLFPLGEKDVQNNQVYLHNTFRKFAHPKR